MMKTTIPLFRPHFPGETRLAIAKDIDSILRDGSLMLGAHNVALESALAMVAATDCAATVNSCTTALTLALDFLGTRGNDVLVPSASFITSVSSITFAGGRPVLVDSNPETLSFSLGDLRRKLTPQTRGLLWVHLTGAISAEADAIVDFARSHGLFIVEDCAHALGAEIGGRKAGSLGDAGCFSFYPTKIVTSGTGGAVVTSNRALDAYVRKMRLFGKRPDDGQVDALGNDWFLDEIRACVARHHLACVPQQAARRQAIADAFRDGLRGVPGITFPLVPEHSKPSYYQFPVFLSSRDDQQRAMVRLNDEFGIQCKKIYTPTHEELCFRQLDDGSLKKTADMLHRSLCLPIHAALSDADVASVIAAVRIVASDLGKS